MKVTSGLPKQPLMNFFLGGFRDVHKHFLVGILAFASCCLAARAGHAQPGKNAPADGFLTGIRLLPSDAAGVVHVPNLPKLRSAWQKTTLNSFAEDNVMQPLVEASFGAEGTLWSQVGDKVGLRGKDLIEIGAGEVVLAWLPFENDRRQPSAVCVLADIRGKKAATQAILDRIDQDLIKNGATRRDVVEGDQQVHIYQPKTRPGQLKIEQVVITASDDRIVAANRESVVIETLQAIAQGGREASLVDNEYFQAVSKQVAERTDVKEPGTEMHWFIRPLSMGRVIRDVAKVDRGNKVKILNLLENQGFDAVKAVGGTIVVRQGEFDLLHRGYVYAPPVTKQADRYRLAARVLQFPNGDLQQLPGWIPKSTATATQMNWKMEDAFWALETLVDEAFNDKIFRPTIGGIRDDEEGPQIDIEANVLPNLGDHLLLLTDNTDPVTIDSERLLVAIEVRNEAPIRLAVQKAMEVEPDVSKIDTIPGVDIWKVQRGENGEAEDEIFDDFDFPEAAEEEEAPLLDTWAIAMVQKSKGSNKPYLIFASHAEYLVEVAGRIQSGAGDGLADQPDIKLLLETTQKQGANQVAIQRIVRLSKSLRTKYELQRRGELKENDSVLSSVVKRLFSPKEDQDIERPNAAKWPEFDQVKKFFQNASSYVETTEDGWALNAFLLH